MNEFAADCWRRALASLEAAEHLVSIDPDSSASRAYYAAFHAVAAYFASQGTTFAKHAQLRAAVHRDLVKAGVWERDMGSAFDFLAGLRETGDYGGKLHVSAANANAAVVKARRIIEALSELRAEELD